MKRKTPLVIVSNTMETTCPEFQTHAPLTCFFAFCFGSSASPIHACLGTLGGKVHCSLIIWCIYVFTAFSSLSFNHLSLTYSCLLLGNIYWAPVTFEAWSRHGEGRNNRRRILASASWPSSHSPGRVSDGIWRSLSILYYQRGNCHKPRAAFPECIHENILTVSSSMRGFSVNLHLQLNANCSLETFFFFLSFNSFGLCSTQKMPAFFCSREGVTPGSHLTTMNRPPWQARCGFGSIKSRTRTWTVSLEESGFVTSKLTWEWPCGAPVPPPGIPVPLWGHPRSGSSAVESAKCLRGWMGFSLGSRSYL